MVKTLSSLRDSASWKGAGGVCFRGLWLRISMRWWGYPPGSSYNTGFHSRWQANLRIFVDFFLRIPRKPALSRLIPVNYNNSYLLVILHFRPSGTWNSSCNQGHWADGGACAAAQPQRSRNEHELVQSLGRERFEVQRLDDGGSRSLPTDGRGPASRGPGRTRTQWCRNPRQTPPSRSAIPRLRD